MAATRKEKVRKWYQKLRRMRLHSMDVVEIWCVSARGPDPEKFLIVVYDSAGKPAWLWNVGSLGDAEALINTSAKDQIDIGNYEFVKYKVIDLDTDKEYCVEPTYRVVR